MSEDKDPLDEMLDLAFTLTNSSFKYYDKAAKKAKMPEVKALLAVIAESESNLLIKLRHMMITGIVDELEELKQAEDRDELPDETPFDPSRAKSDPRIFVCNKTLKKEVKGYTFFLTLAARANTTLVSRLFEYLAHLKMRQIKRIRRVCSTY